MKLAIQEAVAGQDFDMLTVQKFGSEPWGQSSGELYTAGHLDSISTLFLFNFLRQGPMEHISGLKFATLSRITLNLWPTLPPLPECWDYRLLPPYLVYTDLGMEPKGPVHGKWALSQLSYVWSTQKAQCLAQRACSEWVEAPLFTIPQHHCYNQLLGQILKSNWASGLVELSGWMGTTGLWWLECIDVGRGRRRKDTGCVLPWTWVWFSAWLLTG